MHTPLMFLLFFNFTPLDMAPSPLLSMEAAAACLEHPESLECLCLETPDIDGCACILWPDSDECACQETEGGCPPPPTPPPPPNNGRG